jgi:glyoxylase I family protein
MQPRPSLTKCHSEVVGSKICEVTTVAEPGHGAPITGLSHVQLLVSDTEASARWYCAVLGLDLLAEDPDTGYVALRHREAKLVIVLTTGLAPRQMSQDSTEEALDHLAFAVPDADSLRAWAQRLTELGIDHPGVALENGHPSLQLRDPDGIAIELVAP